MSGSIVFDRISMRGLLLGEFEILNARLVSTKDEYPVWVPSSTNIHDKVDFILVSTQTTLSKKITKIFIIPFTTSLDSITMGSTTMYIVALPNIPAVRFYDILVYSDFPMPKYTFNVIIMSPGILADIVGKKNGGRVPDFWFNDNQAVLRGIGLRRDGSCPSGTVHIEGTDDTVHDSRGSILYWLQRSKRDNKTTKRRA